MLYGPGFPVAAQFKADGKGGYLYRKDQVGAAVAATAEERNRHVRRMGWMVLVGAILFFLGMILMAVLADRLIGDPSNTVGVAGALVMGVIALSGLYFFLLWASHAPARAFAGRPQVAPAQARREVFGRRIARVSYTRLFLVSAGMAAIPLFRAGSDPETMWLAAGLPVVVGIGFAIWKWRIETE